MKMTHCGTVKGLKRNYEIELRETDQYWISKEGDRYRKAGGRPTGKTFPSDALMLDSIQPLEEK